MLFSESNQGPGKLVQAAVGILQLPVNPGDLIVLTVGIVIPLFSPSELIPCHKKGRALAQEQKNHGIAQLLSPHLHDPLFPAGAFLAAVPGQVIVCPVPVVLPIGLIVFPVVGHHVHHGESIGIGHVIDDPHLFRIVAGVVGQMVHMALIPFQESPHIHHKPVIILGQMLSIPRLHPIPACCKQLKPAQIRIFSQQF